VAFSSTLARIFRDFAVSFDQLNLWINLWITFEKSIRENLLMGVAGGGD
jgi:hypothetical protein